MYRILGSLPSKRISLRVNCCLLSNYRWLNNSFSSPTYGGKTFHSDLRLLKNRPLS